MILDKGCKVFFEAGKLSTDTVVDTVLPYCIVSDMCFTDSYTVVVAVVVSFIVVAVDAVCILYMYFWRC